MAGLSVGYWHDVGNALQRLIWRKCVESNEDRKDMKQRNQLGVQSSQEMYWKIKGKEERIYITSWMKQCYRYKLNRTWGLI